MAISSYEEMVVDRGIEQAWMTFPLRLADWLVSAQDQDVIVLDPDPENSSMPYVEAGRIEGEIEVRVVWPDDVAPIHYFTGPVEDRLDDLGFEDVADDYVALFLDGHEVDRAAHAVYAVAHEVWGLVHPAFLTAVNGEIDVVDEPTDISSSAPVEPPNVFTPASLDDLRAWVEAHIAARQDQPVSTDGKGNFPFGYEGHRAMLTVRSLRRVEVWTILASNVRRNRARREMDRLSRTYRRHKFFLVDRSLFASVVLDAEPAVVDHVYSAVSATITVHRRESERLKSLLERPRVEVIEKPSVDPLLAAMVGDARRMPLDELVAMIESAANRDQETFDLWLAQARAGRSESRLAANALVDGQLKQMHVNTRRRWERMVMAIKIAERSSQPRGSAA